VDAVSGLPDAREERVWERSLMTTLSAHKWNVLATGGPKSYAEPDFGTIVSELRVKLGSLYTLVTDLQLKSQTIDVLRQHQRLNDWLTVETYQVLFGEARP
jgi:hypothetical protein